eukprot:CAMPEP_0198275468 /NCGR_PEP_ID=MMETSP1447-20131203/64679_1 /TAXON_ID=420782 /ORGANISM="Chaetoceros dichaeta, Strain CCMP1751" /LENGTH=206 /DNA_ID=CAMNT_0043970317 /DNA_START=55 /DNA_END=675 /DNA_ORIENTATION=-
MIVTACVYASARTPQYISDRSNTRAMNLQPRKLGMSEQCLANLDTVSRVGDMSDQNEIGMDCTTEKSNGYTRDTCDSTGTPEANDVIKVCRLAGGKAVTVMFTVTCKISDTSGKQTNIEDMIGPLCVPKQCGAEEFIDHKNSITQGFDIGDVGRCEPTINSYDSFNYFFFGMLGLGTFVVMTCIVYLFWCSKKQAREELRNLMPQN